MDLSPRQLDALHEGYKVLTTVPERNSDGTAAAPKSTRKRPRG